MVYCLLTCCRISHVASNIHVVGGETFSPIGRVESVAVSGSFHEGDGCSYRGFQSEICVYSPRVRRPDLDVDVLAGASRRVP
jgi:hypothetical protein